MRQSPRIMIAGIDPYLALQVARHLPHATILAQPDGFVDLAIVEAGDHDAVALAHHAHPRKTLALADGSGESGIAADRLLVRPFDRTNVLQAVDELIEGTHSIRSMWRGHRLAWGVITGCVVLAAVGIQAITLLVRGHRYVTEPLAFLALFPLIAATAWLASRLTKSKQSELLAQANSALVVLHRIARAMPGGLEIATVAQAACDELRDVKGILGGGVIVVDGNEPRILASFGIDDRALFPSRLLEHSGSGAFSDDGAPGCWLVAPARHAEHVYGAIVARCADHGSHTATLQSLRRLASETAVALENVELFRRVREVATGDERRRIAHTMHDGLAQTLTHLKLELDFIVKHGSKDERTLREHLMQLSSVTDRAVSDVRGLMDDLRTVSLQLNPERRTA